MWPEALGNVMASIGRNIQPVMSHDNERNFAANQPLHAMVTSEMVKSEPAKVVNDFGTVFDDEDEGAATAYPLIPSPPPLPDDFMMPHMGMAGSSVSTSTMQLFNFQQFSERMPMSQPMLTGGNQLVKDLTQEALDMAEANVVYGTRFHETPIWEHI